MEKKESSSSCPQLQLDNKFIVVTRIMRVYLAALLAAFAALLLVANSASVSTVSDVGTAKPTTPLVLSDKPVGILTNRLLRTHDTSDKTKEDRVLNAAIEKLTGLVKTGATKVGNVDWKLLLTGEHSASKLLKWYGLDGGMKKALASPNLKLMENYVKEVNAGKGSKKLSVIGVFTTHYGDDEVAKALVTMQSKAKTQKATDTIKQLRNEQLLAWQNAEKTVDDVFDLLKLRNDGYKALGSPKLEVLDDYIKLVIRTKSTDETLLQTLTKGFGGESKLAALLVRAKRKTSSKEIATALQNALINKWIQVDKLKPEDVYRKLRLDINLDAIFDQNVHTLAAFISTYNKRNPDSTASLIGMFTAQYGDDVVALTLVRGRADKAKNPLAVYMQQLQFEQWMKRKRSGVDIFRYLKISPKDFEYALSSNVEILRGYITALNAVNRDKTDMVTVLSSSVGGEGKLARGLVVTLLKIEYHNPLPAAASVAAEFELALFRRWYKSSIEPTNVYTRILNAEEASATPLEHAVVSRYADYFSDKIASRRNPTVSTVVRPRR